MNPVNFDLVVAGQAILWKYDPVGFIYFISEDICNVRWVLHTGSFKAGVQQIAFDPSNRNLIFGTAVDMEENPSSYDVRLFYIDNSHPSLTDTLYFLDYKMGG